MSEESIDESVSPDPGAQSDPEGASAGQPFFNKDDHAVGAFDVSGASITHMDEYPSYEIAEGLFFRPVFAENLSLNFVTFPPNSGFPAHDHPEEQISIVREGEMEFTIGDMTQLVGPGDARAMNTEGDASMLPAIAPVELASWTVEGRTNFILLDLRPEGATPLLPGAMSISAIDLIDLRRRPSLPKDRVIIVADDADEGAGREVTASLLAGGFEAMSLTGGARSFASDVLDEEATDQRAAAYRLLISGESTFGGAAPPPPATKKAPPKRKTKKSTGCS